MSSGGASSCVLLFVLLSLWRPGGSQEQCPHDEALTILALVPCYVNSLNDSGVSTSARFGRCNYLAYSAARMAAEDWNSHPSVANITVQIRAPKGREVMLDTISRLIGISTYTIYDAFTKYARYYIRNLYSPRPE